MAGIRARGEYGDRIEHSGASETQGRRSGPIIRHQQKRQHINDDLHPVILGNAQGGSAGGSSRTQSGDGGDALIDFRATTYGNGDSMLIGDEDGIEIDFENSRVTRFGALAGQGGDVEHLSFNPNDALMSGSGGDADSRSEGRAFGDSEVTVYDRAEAGSAGTGGTGPGVFRPPSGTGGRGGDATSYASAVGGGASAVLAQSEATAGGGGGNLIISGPGGDADSSAYAKGLGEATATASARAGSISGHGTARALAEASGALAQASAEAVTGNSSGTLGVRVSRETTSRVRLEATAAFGAPLPDRVPRILGEVFITGQPLASDIDRFVAGHANLGALVAAQPGTRFEALGRLAVRGEQLEASTQIMELDISLAIPESGADLALVFSDLRRRGDGFDSLSFRLEIFGELFGEETVFSDFETAQIFFDSVIMLGQAYRGSSASVLVPAVRAIFEVTTLPGQKISLNVVAAIVPEPSTALLIAVGLVFLTIRRPSGQTVRACE